MRILVLGTIVMLSAATMVSATPFFGVGGHVSNFKASDAQEGKTFFGGQVRMRLGGGVGIEASVDYREDRYTSDTQNVTIKSIPMLLSLTTDLLPHSRVTPYLLGGGGWYFTKIHLTAGEIQIDDQQTKFGYHVGGGIAVRPTPRFAIHADYRYTSVKFELAQFHFDATGRMISGGATFYF